MKLKRHEIKSFQCDNCGHREKHIDMYNDEYCYECIDIDSGKLKKDLIGDPKPFKMPPISTTFTNIIPGSLQLSKTSIDQAIINGNLNIDEKGKPMKYHEEKK